MRHPLPRLGAPRHAAASRDDPGRAPTNRGWPVPMPGQMVAALMDETGCKTMEIY